MFDNFCLLIISWPTEHRVRGSRAECAAVAMWPSNGSDAESHDYNMAAPRDVVAGLQLEEKLVAIWPEYPCLYDVCSKEFKNRDKRDVATKEIGAKLERNGK